MNAIDFTAFVDRLALAAGETIRPFFRTALTIEDKQKNGSFDPVTAADRAAESAMRSLIRANFPDHGIIGEELGEERADAEYVWVLDPIDGTKSFISGMPVWGTLIAPHPLRRAGLRHDASAVPRRRVFQATGARRAIAVPPATGPCACGLARRSRTPSSSRRALC